MPLSLLEIVQSHARRQGLPVPASVASNADFYCQQCIGLLDEFNDDLDTRKVWQSNVREATWTATATESQGTLATLAPFGFQGIVPETVFDRTDQLRLTGGLSAQEWAARKSTQFTGPLVAFRLRGNEFLCNPVPSAGHTFAFEYYSNYFVYFPGNNASPAAYKARWTNDADYCIVDDALPVAYLRWAWKREKGFDYAEDFAKYERMVATKSARGDAPTPVDMGGSNPLGVGPGIVVQPGSWSLT